MEQNRKLISSNEQAIAIGIMMRFKNIHQDIMNLEAEMEKIKEQKESLLTELDLTRANDEFYQAQLEMVYGPGKLDTTTLEWVNKTDEYVGEDNERDQES